MRSNLKFLYLMELFAGISRGSYLVCIGWITLIVSDDVARVGQVFIVAMLTNIVAGPLIGVFVDRYNRKSLMIAAHLGISATLSMLACRWFYSGNSELTWMFVAVVCASALRLLYNTALDGLIQGTVESSDLTHTVARCRTVHLLSTVVGTLAAGSIIERVSPGWGLLFSASAAALLVLPMIGVRSVRVKNNAPGFSGLIKDLSGGFDVFRRNRGIRLITILAGVSLPVGQLANAILSSFIRDDLGKGSEAFGIVDASWAMGGMIAAGVLSLGIARLSTRNMEFIFAIAAGVCTVGFAYCTTVPMLVLLHGAMGLTVWLCRIVIDTRILERCASDTVGRTKVYVEMVFSVSAMIMCFSPTLVSLPSASSYFLFWGVIMISASACLWYWNNVTGTRPVVDPGA